MSRPTPRKSRHRNNPSIGDRSGGGSLTIIQQSDYESDAAQYLSNRDTPAISHIPSRTNTELNLSVLSRYLPGGVKSILSIAASATVYLFSETEGWEKCGVEGTMFVVEREPLVTASGQPLVQICVFVLNRRALENLVVDLVKVTDCELAEELIIFRLEDGEQGEESKKVIGIWIHADEEHTREENMTVIRASWQQARMSWNALVQAIDAEEKEEIAEQIEEEGGSFVSGGEQLSGGRRLSITDLFGRNGSG
ncbi:putative dcp1-like decapping family protein [Rhypophila decipiens]|uniref:Dcp1-like decapping family protein n=1 Tax=Rhypophila decipiens TaxID=261697 RepID=A0AAN6Y3P1_9PEZI|nr:putative dcp1-like decapping family protein [Rhypophila decipiens]